MAEKAPKPEMPGKASVMESRACAPSFDPAEFREFLETTGWSSEEKDRYITAVWAVVSAVVQWGLGLHPVQQATNVLEIDSPSVLASEDIEMNIQTIVARHLDEGAAVKEDS